MKAKMLICSVCALILGTSYSAHARPVSYPGGITAMTMNNGESNNLHLHYTPTIDYSIGYKGEYWRAGEYTIQAIQVNNLVKRWNKPDSQANLYVKTGVGIVNKHEDTDPAAFTGIAADWETRRYFTSYENRYTKAGDIDDFFMQSARVGIAPYIGDYGDLHTWLMVQVEHMPEGEEKTHITPMVRFFKDVHLIEAGMSNHGDVMFNWIIRY